MTRCTISRIAAALGILVLVAAPPPAAAQNPQIVPCPKEQQPLLEMPVLDRTDDGMGGGKLQATVKLTNGERILWGDVGDARCAKQQLRYLSGYSGFDPANASAQSGTDPMPGPTLRARVGDLVQVAYFNQVDVKQFASTLDRNESSTPTSGSNVGCDVTTISKTPTTSSATPSGFSSDVMPNCLHG
ncbi:MAG TPA: hypothetical protein VN923_14655, partial [Thermoanaerobaculia bacterium]|nr:hypothetical protein [Thermoanaerobaculia bacterium]